MATTIGQNDGVARATKVATCIYRALPHTSSHKVIFVISIISAFISAIPVIITHETSKTRIPSHLDTILLTDCRYTWSENTEMSWVVIKFSLLYIIPLTFMSVAYRQIIKVLWSKNNVPGQSETTGRPISVCSKYELYKL